MVAAASAHRQAAFEASAFLMDWLKTKAPFWKLEETSEGAQWVDARDSDDKAAARWVKRDPDAAESPSLPPDGARHRPCRCNRPEERRVVKVGVSTCHSRGLPDI